MRVKRDRIKMRIAYSKAMVQLYKAFNLKFLESHLKSYTLRTSEMINELAKSI